jgi:hypothetical protein
MKDLFGDEEFDWRKEWQGMPEFEQSNLKTIHSVVVNFITIEDMNAFSELIGRPIYFTTKSVMFPFKVNNEKKVWIDDEQEPS